MAGGIGTGIALRLLREREGGLIRLQVMVRCTRDPAGDSSVDVHHGGVAQRGLLVEQTALDAGEHTRHGQRVLRTIRRVFRKHRHDELGKLEIHGVRQRGHRIVHMGGGDVDRRRPGERTMPAQALVGHDTERIDVGLWRGLPCACSGEMYCAVPTIMPSCVICSWFVE